MGERSHRNARYESIERRPEFLLYDAQVDIFQYVSSFSLSWRLVPFSFGPFKFERLPQLASCLHLLWPDWGWADI